MNASQGWTARRDNAPRRGLAPGLRKEAKPAARQPKVKYLRAEYRDRPDDGGDDQARSAFIDELLARRRAAEKQSNGT
jgi:hypothetical protein